MTLPTPTYKYQFDPTGSSASNLLVDFEVSLTLTDPHTVVLPDGVFYTNGFTMVNASDDSIMVVGVDYEWVSIDESITAHTGLEAASGIQFTDSEFVGTVRITCQLVGGLEGMGSRLIDSLTEAITGSQQAQIHFAQILGRPATYPPDPDHLHELSELTEIGLLKEKLDDVINALTGRHPMFGSHNEHSGYIRSLLSIVAEQRRSINTIDGAAIGNPLLTELLNKVNNSANTPSVEETVVQSSAISILEWAVDANISARGFISFTSDTDTHVVDVTLTCTDNNTRISSFGEIRSGNALFTLNENADVSNINLMLMPAVNGSVKIMWYAIF